MLKKRFPLIKYIHVDVNPSSVGVKYPPRKKLKLAWGEGGSIYTNNYFQINYKHNNAHSILSHSMYNPFLSIILYPIDPIPFGSFHTKCRVKMPHLFNFLSENDNRVF